MRNLLGRLHARQLPELFRIAEAWGVPLRGESKGEVVGTLYRAMTHPGAMRDIWARLDADERAMIAALADLPDGAASPTIAEIAARLETAESEIRETALRLYRAGILAREGDDDPLPIGMLPRVLLPREIALHVRRLQDEMAAGDLTRVPLRVLLELLDDAELETAARTWGMRLTPGETRRAELTSRLLRMLNDQARINRVVRSLSRDAATIWAVVHAAEEPVALAEAAANANLGRPDPATGARLRAALAELERALLVWHAYGGDQMRRLFVPAEIRAPGEAPVAELPQLAAVQGDIGEVTRWRHPDALAWDLLSLLRIGADRQAPAWEVADQVPRWVARSVNQRLWSRGRDGPPVGYLETLTAFAIAEGLLAVDADAKPPRAVIGPNLRAWRGCTFPEQTIRLREWWLRLPRWIEGEPAGVVEVRGADWRGMRPRLLAALADAETGLEAGAWVSLESLAARLAARVPGLLGPSFSAATARMGGVVGAGGDVLQARHAAISDVIAVELTGPFAWFGLTEIADPPGQPRAVRLTQTGVALPARGDPPAEDAPREGLAPLSVANSGEIALLLPSPERVWALSAFTEQVDLGRESHYRLTPGSVSAALAAGIGREQITAFLERASRQPLPPDLAQNLERWAPAQRHVRIRRAIVLSVDESTERTALMHTLGEGGWNAEPLGDHAVLVSLPARLSSDAAGTDPNEASLIEALRAAKIAVQWSGPVNDV